LDLDATAANPMLAWTRPRLTLCWTWTCPRPIPH
jgi:hypothetical protein